MLNKKTEILLSLTQIQTEHDNVNRQKIKIADLSLSIHLDQVKAVHLK